MKQRGLVKSMLDVKRDGLTKNINDMKRAFDHLSRMLTKKEVRVIFKGTSCYVEGKKIVLPDLALLERKNMNEKEMEEARTFLEVVRGYLFHEVAHIIFTDMPALHAARAKHPATGYAANCVEDVRIERFMSKEWRGAGVSLSNMNEWMLTKQKDSLKVAPLVSKVMNGVAWVARSGTNHWFFKQLDDDTKALMKKFAPEIRMCRTIETTAEAVAVAKKIVSKLRKMIEEEKEKKKREEEEKKKKGAKEDEEDDEKSGKKQGDAEEESEPADDDSDDDDSMETPTLDDEEPRKAKKKKGSDDDDEDSESDDDAGEGDEGSEEGSDDGDGEEDGEGPSEEALKQLEDELNDEEETVKKAEEATDKSKTLKKSIVMPPGDDNRYLVYTTEFDEVKVAEKGSPSEYALMLKEAKASFGIMKRSLANVLKARAQKFTVSELEEGDLDQSLLYRLATKMSDRVFKEDFEQLELHNVSVLLLVNESGSMSEQASIATNKTRIQLAQETCALLGEVLESLDVNFAIYGHTTKGNAPHTWREAAGTLPSGVDLVDAPLTDDHKLYSRWGGTVINQYKSFEEHFAHVKARLTSLSADANTHDAEALLFAGNILLNEKQATRRVIITIDDGAPMPNLPFWFSSFLPRPGMKPIEKRMIAMAKLHQEYVREVVSRLDSLGVEVLGMGMGTEDVKHFYANAVVVNNVADFPRVALNELKKILIAGQRKAMKK